MACDIERKGRCEMNDKPRFEIAVALLVLAVILSACKPTVETEGATASAAVTPDQQQRLEILKSMGLEASLTILPARVGGNPFDRLTEAIGWLLEQKGLKNIELGKTAFTPGNPSDLAQMAGSLGEHVKNASITTEYALYADFKGQDRVDEIIAMVVDKSGALVWSERLTPRHPAWKALGGDGDLLVCCTALVESLAPQFGLDEQTAKAATPGKMARIMAERSGVPPDEETAPMPERQKVMKQLGPEAALVVYPVRVGGNQEDAEGAGNIAKMINEAGLCKADPAGQSLLLQASQADPNEMKNLWDLAREFREYIKKNPVDADYVLYADCLFNPQNWEQGIVHFVVCDRQGDWVIVDMQNAHHPDYQSIKPVSKQDCHKLLVKRLQSYLR